MKYKLIFLVATLIGFYSCKENKKVEPQLNGIWNSMGYGWQIIVTDSLTTVYNIYEGGCALNIQLPKNSIENYYEVKRLTNDSLTIRSGFTDYNFIRSNSESKICGEHSKSKDPLTNFDALWHTFNENYSSFELRGIDWENMKEKYRPQLNSKSTDLELYAVLKAMTSELHDGHVFIEIPESLEDEIDEDEDDGDELRESVISAINSKYVDSLKTYNKGNINWGIINGTIGYIQINDFEDLANYPIDQELSAEAFWDEYWGKAKESQNYSKDVLSGFKEQMARIFDDIEQTKSCIIDVRFNGGGFDQIGLEVLSYFIDKKTIAFSKKARFQNGYTKKQVIYIEPNEKAYTGNVYILTSYQTASASETFVLASQNLPNSKRIGSNTEGILSDILSKRLPNGWAYGLSNEIYESSSGTNFERNGIPADYELNYSKDSEEFYTNLLLELKKEDRAIEKAIELNAEKTAPNAM